MMLDTRREYRILRIEEIMAKKFTGPGQYLKPDPKCNSKLVSKLVNCLMLDGKKSVAQRVFYDALDIISKRVDKGSHFAKREAAEGAQKGAREESSDSKSKVTALEVFETAVNNVKPMVEVRSKRVGGASYQVPMQVSSKRQQSLAFRWILQSARDKKGKPMCERLANELIDAYEKRGGAMTVRENVHRMAEANKAFAHFAW